MTASRRLSNPSHRSSKQQAFLNNHGWEHKHLSFLAGDASLRTYYRLHKGTQSLVLMDAPPPENPYRFVQVSQYLQQFNLSIPTIIAEDHEHGFLLIEDFGDATYTRLLESGSDPYPLYTLAIDVLIELHQQATQKPDFIEDYSIDKLLAEAEGLLDWYYPHTKGKTISSLAKNNYLELWHDALTTALQGPHSLILRDYHVDNLMFLQDRKGANACGLLDFQDAVWGPVSYDIVSLLEDARRDVDENLRQAMWQRYLQAFPEHCRETIQTSATILSAGRHAKILGFCVRAAVRDHKTQYLAFIPRVWCLLQQCLAHPELHKVKHWFDEHLDQEPTTEVKIG